MKEMMFILLGVLAGVMSGLFGIGGGIIIIPALVFLAGFTQHEAQGTTLAIFLLPVGIFAAMRYYKSGHIHIFIALLICLGFVLGSFFGANVAESLTNIALKRAFGIFLLVMSISMIFSK
ncbi:MAG: sulfite exporter TauE/SafE family protein [Candidatus Omnitrophica bacterium]|nr:sulfite exporter TauE/SafE family protein [Candidatus Omnitrophota bacterium]